MVTAADFLPDDHFMQEPANPAPGVLLIACTIGKWDADDVRGRVVLVRDGAWFDFVREKESFGSIAAHQDGRGFVLGDSTVYQFDWRATDEAALRASVKRFPNDEAATTGPLRRIRVVGDDIVTVGTAGQVYVLRREAFAKLPIVEGPDGDFHLKDVSGTGSGDLLAASLDGYLAHFDGTAWSLCNLPTNVQLKSICRLPDGRYAVAGVRSTVLIGIRDQWQIQNPIQAKRDYMGVATFSGEIFLSYLGGADRVEGTGLRPVVLPKTVPGLEWGALIAGSDGIWSASGHSVGRVSQTGWQPLT